MSRITVWKCDQTNKLFEDKTKYQTHLRRLAKERTMQRRLWRHETAANAWWAEAFETERSIKDWPEFVIKNQLRFWAEAVGSSNGYWSNVGKVISRKRNAPAMPIPVLLEFSKFNLQWSLDISNSHSCPHNGVENWSGNVQMKDGSLAPRGYPGWTGHVEWIVQWPEEYDGIYLGSDLFRANKKVRAYAGSGGGGGMRYSHKYECFTQSFGYSVNIFAADWPGMVKHELNDQFEQVLKGERTHVDTW